jgi:alpha-1,6-mannosyltransferase
MKVLDVTEFFSERGGGVRSHLTAKGHILCQLGHEHIVVAPGPVGETRLGPSRLIRVGGPPMPYDPSYHFLWRADSVRRVVIRERPDVLEIHSPYVAAVGALACPRSSFSVRTFCWHSDFIDTYQHVLKVPGLFTAPLWAWVRRIGRGCDATIAAAQWQVDKLRDHGVPRVVHLPFGVDKSIFRDRGSPRTEGLLVGVGRFAIEKRWDVVIEAFLKLNQPARLVLYGDGPERARLERMGKGRVEFAGFLRDRDELARALSAADALVHGCPYETFGISIAEAVSCGLPVVVPDQGGAAEQAEAAFAETYESGDPIACAAAIERLLSRDRASLRQGAREAATRVWSTEHHFEELVQLYQRLISS